MDSFKKYGLPFLILLLFLSLALGFRSFLMANIVEPIALFFWAAWRVVSSVDQAIYWIVLIVFCLIPVFRFAVSGKDVNPRSAYNHETLPLNRVEHWQRLIKDTPLGRDERETLRASMKELLISVTAQLDRTDSTLMDQMITNAPVSLPLKARLFLFPQAGKGGIIAAIRQLNIPSLLPRWLRRWARIFHHQDNTWIDETLGWLENELEIHYE
jgi:hypothetical protein